MYENRKNYVPKILNVQTMLIVTFKPNCVNVVILTGSVKTGLNDI